MKRKRTSRISVWLVALSLMLCGSCVVVAERGYGRRRYYRRYHHHHHHYYGGYYYDVLLEDDGSNQHLQQQMVGGVRPDQGKGEYK